jgi:hypothetical protein
MGVERVLQAAHRRLIAGAGLAILAATPASAAPMAKTRERVAVIDLGPSDGGAIRRSLAAAIVGAGLEPVLGDGLEDALAGEAADADALQLAVAIGEAQRAFGALDCKAASYAARTAIGFGAARQAAGLAVPELPRAWTYLLLCADRASEIDAAMRAAAHLRALGGSAEVPAEVWAKYPDVDAMLDRDVFPLEITTTVPGAEVWIDFQRVGVSPLKTFVAAGEHVIATAHGTSRGWAAGTAVKTQTTVSVPMKDQASATTALAARVAGWNGEVPAPAEIAAVLDQVHARVALIRHGQIVEAWGHIGKSEAPRKLGGEDGVGTLTEADRLAALINDRVHTWNDRAPDPDQPLLVEDPRERLRRNAKADEPTRWWVYAALIGAAAVGAGVWYLHDTATNTQQVELHYP